MEIFDPKIPFDPTKPFYSIVIAYAAQLHGILDLASRGIRLQLESINPEMRAATQEGLISKLKEENCSYAEGIRAVIASPCAPLLGEPRPGTVFGKGAKIDTDVLAKELFMSHQSPIR